MAKENAVQANKPQDMAGGTVTEATTLQEIFAQTQPDSRQILKEVLGELYPPLGGEFGEIKALISPESANSFLSKLTDLESVLSVNDTYDETVAKLQALITDTERVRDEVFSRLMEYIRPIERSYRSLDVFFRNAQGPAELLVLNLDPAAMTDAASSLSCNAIVESVEEKNKLFNYRVAICNLVVPGFLTKSVQDQLEHTAKKYGVLLISDLEDDKSVKAVTDKFREEMAYEYLVRQDDEATSHVVLASWIQVRKKHAKEFARERLDDDGLYVPASLAFAGAMIRTDLQEGVQQGPVGMKHGHLIGIEKSRIEANITEQETLGVKHHLIPIVRDHDNNLCFYGSRTLAEDEGYFKFFTGYRIFHLVERSVMSLLRTVAHRTLTRELINEDIDPPLRRYLQELTDQKTLLESKLNISRETANLSQGILKLDLEFIPPGPAERFYVTLNMPLVEIAKEENP